MKYKVIKIGASWCGPCKVLDKSLNNFSKCNVEKYDVEEVDDDFLSKYNIRNVPVTIIVDESGSEVKRWNGLFDIKELESKLDELEDA
jgi:thiol-disulfide isomerase/thioredoxin